jgi:hypothetical protein
MFPIKLSVFDKVNCIEIFDSVVIEEKSRFSLFFGGFFRIFAFCMRQGDFFYRLGHHNNLLRHIDLFACHELAGRFCLVCGCN